MNALAARRRHPAAIAILLMLGLVAMGFLYAAAAPTPATATTANTASVEEGKQLFQANCASCHGLNAEGRRTGATIDGEPAMAGPSLVGVGAAAVDFQVGTGRMPMRAPSAQAPREERKDRIKFNQEQIDAMSAYIDSLGGGPSVPTDEMVDASKGNPAQGNNLFRVNCAMCHNSSGAGGALTRGKYAPSLTGVTEKHIYEAMETGPQAMPVFNDANLSPEDKRDVIAFLKTIEEEPAAGGAKLGSLGPVPEGMFAWIFGLGIMIGAAIWLGAKSG